MRSIKSLLIVTVMALPGVVQAADPNLVGSWSCDPSPILIRGDWSTLTYQIDFTEQKDGLLKGSFAWALPEENGVPGNQKGKDTFVGKTESFGVIAFDGSSVDIVSYNDLNRHTLTIVDADTFHLSGSEVGNDAWVSRTTCKRGR